MSAEAGGITATRLSSEFAQAASSLQSSNAFCPAWEPSYASKMRLNMDTSGTSVHYDFEGFVPDPATSYLQFKPPVPFGHQRHELLVDVAARPRREDRRPVVEAAPPAVEMPDLDHRLTGRGEAHAFALGGEPQGFRVRQLLRRREPVRPEVAAVHDAHVDSRQIGAEPLAFQHFELDFWDKRRDAQEGRALLLADLGDLLEGRIRNPDAQVEPAHLDLAELRMLDLPPLLEDTTLVHVAIPLGERVEILPLEMPVNVDERLHLLHADLREDVPQLDHIREAGALVIGVIGGVALDGGLGLVEEFVEAAHRGIAGVLLCPRLDLAIQREVVLVHLVVGLVA